MFTGEAVCSTVSTEGSMLSTCCSLAAGLGCGQKGHLGTDMVAGEAEEGLRIQLCPGLVVERVPAPKSSDQALRAEF